MRMNPTTPADRELNAGTGISLTVLGLAMLLLCYFADGHLAALPAQIGKSFAAVGVLILLWNRPRGSR